MSDSSRSHPVSRFRATTPGFALIVALGIGLYGLFRFEMIVGAEYRVARILAVQQVAGADLRDRLVIVDLGEYPRALRTSDWMLRTHPGQPVCVKRATYLLLRWVRHVLVLPG